MKREGESRFEDGHVLLLHKGKRGLMRMVFGRTMVIILLLAIQVLLLFAAFYRLGEYYFGSAILLSLVVSLAIINRPGKPTVKITWILLITLVPVFAIPFYFFAHAELGHRLVYHWLRTIEGETAQYAPRKPGLAERLMEEDPGKARLGRLCGAGQPAADL